MGNKDSNIINIEIQNNEISNKDSNIPNNIDNLSKNNNTNNDKTEKKVNMVIHSNFISANYQYVKHIKSKSSNKKSKNEEDNENNYYNKNKESLHPYIHFTNLSSKKLKILGSISKSKSEHSKTDI